MSLSNFNRLRLINLLLLICAPAPYLLAHDNITIHPMLMDKGYESWSNKQELFDAINIKESETFSYSISPDVPSLKPDNIIVNLPKLQPWTTRQWLMAGAVDEDDPLTTCFAHFYSPIPISGTHALTDPVGLGGRDSFGWASTGGSFSPPFPFSASGENQESWEKARKYYLDALTKSTKSLRDEKLAHTFYALGKVSHLLQDLSQPDHVRNDAHLINNDFHLIGPKARWIENYGQQNRRGLEGVSPD